MRKIAPAIGLRLRGTVAADSTGGSTVTLALDYRPQWSAIWPILAASGVALFFLARSVTSWPFAAAVAAGVAFIWWRFWIADRALGRRSDSLAAYLLERVESVITDVELNTPHAPADGSGGPVASRSAN